MKIKKILPLQIIISVLLVNAAWAAEETNQQGGATQPTEPASVFDISFPGGTLEEFIEAVGKALAAHVRNAPKPNLIVPADAKPVRMPKLELRSVDMRTLITATSMLLQPEHTWQPVGGKNTFVLVTRTDARKTQAYYIGHLLKKFKVADITTALETVWQMGSNAKTELKYHEDTQMLIVRADRSQIEMAENVLTQLRDALAEQAPKFPTPAAGR